MTSPSGRETSPEPVAEPDPVPTANPWTAPPRRPAEPAPPHATGPAPPPARPAPELAAPEVVDDDFYYELAADLAPVPAPAVPRPRRAPPRDGSAPPERRHGRSSPVPARRGRPGVGVPGARPVRPPKPPRRAGAGLAALLLLSFMAAFFGWVSAEPLWLALGHGDRGTAIVVRCTGKGVGQRCTGDFTALDGRFSVQRVALLGAAKGERHAGATVTAWMVSAESRSAYAGDRTSLHLRWAVGLLLVLACGFGIGLATGATRLAGRRARFGAFVASVGAPLMIAAGFLAATF